MADVQYTAKESLQTAKKEGRRKPIQLPLRLVVFADIDTNKRMGILASNHVKTAGDIAYYMLNRWGDSENLYKKLAKLRLKPTRVKTLIFQRIETTQRILFFELLTIKGGVVKKEEQNILSSVMKKNTMK